MSPSNENEFSLSPEIDRLSSQLAKDPKSKLFMPLAEEYIKSGMAEEAVMTLEEGLKVHPAYMSARVLLGKAFLEKNDLERARAQFETVVKSIPDNLFAHKKLGEVFKALGMYPEAIKSYKMVLMLHPKDADARMALDILEGGMSPAQAKPEAPEPKKPAPQVFDLADVGGDGGPVEALDEPVPVVPGASDAPAVMEMPVPEMETLEQVKKAQAAEESIPAEVDDDFGFSAVEADEEDEEISAPQTYVIDEDVEPVPSGGVAFTWGGEADDAHDLLPEVESDIFDMESSPLAMEDENYEVPLVPAYEALEPAASDDAFSWGGEAVGVHDLLPEVESDVFDMESSPLVMEDEPFEPADQKPAAGSGYAIDLGEVAGVKDIFDAYKDDSSPGTQVGENEGVYEIPDDLSAFAMEGFKLEPPKFAPEPVEAVKARPEPPAKPAKELFETETLAELYVSQGFYDRAINIYKSLSMERPDDKTLMQKLQELYQLAHMSALMNASGIAVDTGAVAPVREAYTPVDFEAIEEAEDAAVFEETPAVEAVPEEDFWAVPIEPVPAEEFMAGEELPETEIDGAEFDGAEFDGAEIEDAEFAEPGTEAGFMESALAEEDVWQAMPQPQPEPPKPLEPLTAMMRPAAGRSAAGPGAVGHLESLLDKIRRKRAI